MPFFGAGGNTIRMVVPVTPLICSMVVPISGVTSLTIMRIACAIGIGYRHDGSMGFYNDHFTVNFVFNY